MTDENPSPTTRIPVPGSASPPDAPTQGWPGSPGSSEPPSPPPPSAPPERPVPPVPPPADASARHDGRDHGRTASVLFGLVILGLGLWFFAEHTLGMELPRIRWSQAWPVFLIGIGLWVVLGSLRRGSR